MALAFTEAPPAAVASISGINVDSGLESLCLLASILGERLDPGRIRHEHLAAGDNEPAVVLRVAVGI